MKRSVFKAIIFMLVTVFSLNIYIYPGHGASKAAAGTSSIKVQFFNYSRDASNNTIYPEFKVYNTGSTVLDLSTLKLRYYYTIDGEKTQNYWCDWVHVLYMTHVL